MSVLLLSFYFWIEPIGDLIFSTISTEIYADVLPEDNCGCTQDPHGHHGVVNCYHESTKLLEYHSQNNCCGSGCDKTLEVRCNIGQFSC